MTLDDLDKAIERTRIEFAMDWLACMRTQGAAWEEIERVLREKEWLRESLLKGLRERTVT